MKRFIKKWWYVLKYIKANAITEYNRKDNFRFYTNFNKKDIDIYKTISKKLGIEYRIEDNATDMYDRPCSDYYAYYISNYSNMNGFHELYSKLKDEKYKKATKC
jgi:hypothetical protein